MKNLGKIIGAVTLGALAASVIPYRFKRDEDTGAYELGALLWSLKKAPGKEEDTYTLQFLPLLGKKEKADEAPEEELFDIPSAEEIIDKAAAAAEEAVEAAKGAAEEAVEAAKEVAEEAAEEARDLV